MGRVIYFTIETKVRELDAKVLLSLEAAKRGYICIIGTKVLMHKLKYFNFPKGFFFYKDSVPVMKDIFKLMKFKGHEIIVHDEEGYIQLDWNDYVNRRIKSDTLKYIDKYLCWGKEQYTAILKASETINPNLSLEITGHPRIDILKEPVKEYNKSVIGLEQKIILINTKFGDVNYKHNGKNWIEKYKDCTNLSECEIKKFDDMYRYKKELLAHYNSLIESIATKFENCLIIIRPHPVENVEYWKEKFDKYNNVKVTNDYPIGYWLNQANVVIHTGCTTAVEALLMEVPVIAYKPVVDERFEIELPNSISFVATTEYDCLERIAKLINKNYDKNEYLTQGKEKLSRHLAYLDQTQSTSVIIDAIDNSKGKTYKYNFLTKFKIRVGFLFLENLFNGYQFILRKRYQENENLISVDEVRATVDKFKKVLNDSKEYKVHKLAKNVVLISADNIQ